MSNISIPGGPIPGGPIPGGPHVPSILPMNRLLIPCVAICALLAAPRITSADDLQGFFQQHCIECHGPDQQEASLRLDTLADAGVSGTTAATWSHILQMIETGEMPPVDQPRPNAADARQAARQIIDALADTAIDRPSALRRMNRREYEHTVHDLLGIDTPLVDLLPEDGSVQGFDNVADGLTISSVLMERYLEAADAAFAATIRRIKPLPPATRRVELMQVPENIDSVEQQKGGTIAAHGAFVKFTPGWPPARLDPVHPIEAGVYRCRVAVWPHDPGDRTLSVAIYVGSLFGPETRKLIGIYDVTGTPQAPRIIEFTTPMQEGHAIHVLPRIWPEHVTWRDKHEARPGVAIAWAETHGPLDQSFPSAAQRRLFGDFDHLTMVEDQPIYMRHRRGVKLHVVDSAKPREDAARIIRDLIARAFRRPVTDDEMAPFIALTLARLDQGRTFEQAIRAGVTAVLCSPQFLLLNRESIVDDYTIASRLSYFLWSTMPDEELLQLAAAGQLADPEVRKTQVRRMIADERIERFVDHFTGQWLDLRDIEFTTPDAKLYPEFDPLLQEAMLAETRHFFRHILRENLSILNFVDADWTFLNERLAKHYGVPGPRGNETFHKVVLPADSIRGGVLTHASVLKVTANGTTTSPIIRGAWVLDHILARPAPPPPPGVPAVEPDIRGATSIREQFEKHRDPSACARCHRSIDPPGFALEQFDAIGGQRQWYRSLGDGETLAGKLPYRKGLDVNPASQLADGRTFADFAGYRARLLEDRQHVARGIVTKLLIYATGRPITAADRRTVDEIVDQAARHDLGLRSVIDAVVQSDYFLQP